MNENPDEKNDIQNDIYAYVSALPEPDSDYEEIINNEQLFKQKKWKYGSSSVTAIDQIYINGFRKRHVQRFITKGQAKRIPIVKKGLRLNRDQKVLKVSRNDIEIENGIFCISHYVLNGTYKAILV